MIPMFGGLPGVADSIDSRAAEWSGNRAMNMSQRGDDRGKDVTNEMLKVLEEIRDNLGRNNAILMGQ